MTSMRRRYVASTSFRRRVPAGNLPPPPQILNLGPPPNILNLPTPMNIESEDMDIDSSTAICEAKSRQISPVSEVEVQKALRLENNKAADSMGLCSEHLKLGGQPVVEFVTSM